MVLATWRKGLCLGGLKMRSKYQYTTSSAPLPSSKNKIAIVFTQRSETHVSTRTRKVEFS